MKTELFDCGKTLSKQIELIIPARAEVSFFSHSWKTFYHYKKWVMIRQKRKLPIGKFTLPNLEVLIHFPFLQAFVNLLQCVAPYYWNRLCSYCFSLNYGCTLQTQLPKYKSIFSPIAYCRRQMRGTRMEFVKKNHRSPLLRRLSRILWYKLSLEHRMKLFQLENTWKRKMISRLINCLKYKFC